MRDALVNVRPDLRLTISPSGGREAGIDAAAIRQVPGVAILTGLDGLGACVVSPTANSDASEMVNIFNTWIERWGKHRWWACDPQDAQARELSVILGRPAEGICRMGSDYPKDGFWWPDAQLRITPAFSGGVHFMRHYAHAVARFVTVRTLVDGGKRYVYLVNQEHYPIQVVVRLAHPTGKIVNLSTNAQTDTAGTWRLVLGPYELQSFLLSSTVDVAAFTASPPPDIVAQLTRDAHAVLDNIRARQSAGAKLPPDTTGLAGAIQAAMNQGRPATLRQLLESVTIVQNFLEKDASRGGNP